MTEFILFFIAYFLLTFTLSKIAEKEEIDWDWLAWFLILFPPLYILYITKRFPVMLFITILIYWLVNFLVLKWISLFAASFLFIIPILIWFTYILHNLKADQKLNLFNVFPPVLWSFWLLIYLAFFYITPEEELMEIKRNSNDCDKWKSWVCNKMKSDFHWLNKNLFKEFDKIDYDKINDVNYF